MDIKTSDIFCEEFRERYRKDGYSEQQIDQIQQDTIYFRKMYLKKSDQREITSATYIRSQKRIDKKIKDWFL
jgi:hypothetical protein